MSRSGLTEAPREISLTARERERMEESFGRSHRRTSASSNGPTVEKIHARSLLLLPAKHTRTTGW